MNIEKLSFYDQGVDVDIKRNRLAHWHQGDILQYITFRLYGTLPLLKCQEIDRVKGEYYGKYGSTWPREAENECNDRVETIIHAWVHASGHGALFESADARDEIEKTLKAGDGRLYELFDYVIMPNHLHLLLAPLPETGSKLQQTTAPISRIMHFIKRNSAAAVNRRTAHTGPLWQKDYFDKMVRSANHLRSIQLYIFNNPKGLPPRSYTLRSLLPEELRP